MLSISFFICGKSDRFIPRSVTEAVRGVRCAYTSVVNETSTNAASQLFITCSKKTGGHRPPLQTDVHLNTRNLFTQLPPLYKMRPLHFSGVRGEVHGRTTVSSVHKDSGSPGRRMGVGGRYSSANRTDGAVVRQ